MLPLYPLICLFIKCKISVKKRNEKRGKRDISRVRTT